MAMLWSYSYPGFGPLSFMAGALGLVVGAAVWIVRALLYLRAKNDASRQRRPRLFAVAPLAGLFVVALLWTDVPLRLRWALAKGDFEERLPAALADDEYFDIKTRRFGTYKITSIERNHEAVIFHESAGNLFDDAGFAYLPNGPRPALENGNFEVPQWTPLGGHWYAWTASW
jgi:hypothetical protein